MKELPAVGDLDGLHGTSDVPALKAELASPVLQRGTQFAGEQLYIDGAGETMAYAIYAIGAPEAELLAIKAEGSGDALLMIADYGAARWKPLFGLNSGAGWAPLGGWEQWTSPSGACYIAVVCAEDSSGILKLLALEHAEIGQEPVTYHVSAAGSDENEGSAENPWLTLQHAADQILPGDTVRVSAGEYAGFDLSIHASGERPISFVADSGVLISLPAEGADAITLLDSTWVTIDGFRIEGPYDSGVYMVNCSSIQVLNNIITGCDDRGIYAKDCSNLMISGNRCTDSELGHGIEVVGACNSVNISDNYCGRNYGVGIRASFTVSDSIIMPSDILISGNRIFGNSHSLFASLDLKGIKASQISNNLITSNHWTGISIRGTGSETLTHDVTVTNNTVYCPADTNACLDIDEGCTDITVCNNILLGGAADIEALNVDSSVLGNFVSDNNVVSDLIVLDGEPLTLDEWQLASLQDLASLSSEAALVFEEVEGNVFRLQAGSAPVDLALPEFAPAVDIDGTARPFGAGFDCGAYECIIASD